MPQLRPGALDGARRTLTEEVADLLEDLQGADGLLLAIGRVHLEVWSCNADPALSGRYGRPCKSAKQEEPKDGAEADKHSYTWPSS
jgi:hypothetical protein